MRGPIWQRVLSSAAATALVAVIGVPTLLFALAWALTVLLPRRAVKGMPALGPASATLTAQGGSRTLEIHPAGLVMTRKGKPTAWVPTRAIKQARVTGEAGIGMMFGVIGAVVESLARHDAGGRTPALVTVMGKFPGRRLQVGRDFSDADRLALLQWLSAQGVTVKGWSPTPAPSATDSPPAAGATPQASGSSGGVGLAALVALGGAAVWALVLGVTGYETGLVASLLAGYLANILARRNGRSWSLAFAAFAFAVVAMVLGKVVGAGMYVQVHLAPAGDFSWTRYMVAVLVEPWLLLQPMDLLWCLIAAYACWRIAAPRRVKQAAPPTPAGPPPS